MKKRTGVIGGIVGGAAATTALAAVAIERRAEIRRQRRRGEPGIAPLAADRHGRVVADDGTGLYYEEVGPSDAPLTIIFVHGYTLSMKAFHFQRAGLREQFGDRVRMVFFDQRSHGRSELGAPKHSTIEQLGRDLRAVLETLVPTGPVALVGHSMGGMTILALAQSNPELFAATGRRGGARIAAVALLATSAGELAAVTFGLPALLAKLKGPLLPLMLRGARSQASLIERGRAIGTDFAWMVTRRLAFGGSDVPPATVEYLTTMIASTRIEVIADFYPALMSHDKLAALSILTETRVMIICGDRDLITPLEHSKAIAEALPKAELVVVPQGGHAALLEHPDVVNEALHRLLDSTLDDGHRRWWRRS